MGSMKVLEGKGTNISYSCVGSLEPLILRAHLEATTVLHVICLKAVV